MEEFVHLHVHSEYSLLDGAGRVKDLVKRAVELGMPALAITDHGVLYGVIDFYREAIKAGIKPIIGCEVYVAPRSRYDRESGRDSEQYHLILLCKNEKGYKNLIEMVSRSYTEGFYYKPRVDHELLALYSEGLIALSACVAGEIPRMIFTFLNRETYYSIDLSSLLNYTPEQIIFYYYDSCIELPFTCYQVLRDAADIKEEPDQSVIAWLRLMEEDLKCHHDLISLKDNEFIQQLGPYYYTPTNTRFYFRRESSSTPLTASDFELIMDLKNTPAADQALHKYNKSRKNAKKAARNKEELLEDISMCMSSLQEIEKINRHINYLNKFLEMRYAIMQYEELEPAEPDNIPEKPPKPAENERGTLNNLIPFSRSRQKQSPQSALNYNHDMKVYIIRYREYEKACDRYKEALEQWTSLSENLLSRCMKEIEQSEQSLKNARRMLSVYNNIISRSYIHIEYQDIYTLSTFRHYLDTGRCADLQDCMNVWADEKHWSEIKASQERIENTIYFLQNGSEYTRFADRKINEMLNHMNEPAAKEEDKVSSPV